MESGNMSLQTVLNNLSKAIQNKAEVSGPLTLQQMISAVNNISGNTSSAIKFYRCTEYSPRSQTINVSSGTAILDNGSKISLAGEYRLDANLLWQCPATTARGEYASASLSLITVMISLQTSETCFMAFVPNDKMNYYIAVSQYTDNITNTAYIEDVDFSSGDSATLTEAIELSGDTSSFCNVFSGFEIVADSEITWQESTVLTKGLIPQGYIPEPGKIYSYNTSIAVSSLYPDQPEESIKFYECTEVNQPSAGAPLYDHVITLSGWSEAESSSPAKGYGIYYPEDLSVDPALRIYSRKDGSFKIKVKNANSSTGQIALVDASENIIAATPFMELTDIWNIWDDYGYCNFFYPSEAETAWEDGAMPMFFGNRAEWCNGNVFSITNAGSPEVNCLYVRGSGSNEFFSAGCYESWINDNGSAAIYWIEDWIVDNEDNYIYGLLLKSSRVLYEMPTPELGWDTRFTTADQFKPYTWQVTNGTLPLPEISDAARETAADSGGFWSGYEMIKRSSDHTFLVADAAIEDCNGVYTVYKFASELENIIYSNGRNYMYIEYSPSGYLWRISDQPIQTATAQRFYHSYLFDFNQHTSPADIEWYPDLNGRIISVTTVPGGWQRNNILKENMPIVFITPQVGKVYSEDTSIQIDTMYSES